MLKRWEGKEVWQSQSELQFHGKRHLMQVLKVSCNEDGGRGV